MDILSIVKKRHQTAQKNQEKKFERFNDFDYIYHSVLKYNDPNIPSKVFNPVLWSYIETIVTRMLAKSPIIAYKPREHGDQSQSDIFSDLFAYWFQKADAYPIMVAWVKDALIYGTGIVKIDWHTSVPRMVKSYQTDPMGQPMLDEQGNFVTIETPVVDYDDPRLTNVNIYDFFIDPKARSIKDAKWVIHQYWADINDLEAENKSAEQFGKTIYNKAALRRLRGRAGKVKESTFEETRKEVAGMEGKFNDETVSRIKIWEMWENNKCVVVADETEVLRDEENYFWHGMKPFSYIVDSIVPHEFYGKGEIEPVEKMLHALNTTQNQRITNVNRILSPMWIANDRVDDAELNFIDNGIIHVTEKDDATMLSMPDVTAKAYQEQESILEQMQRSLGVTDLVQGLDTGAQTAHEVDIKTSQANARFAHKTKLFEEMGLKDVGEFVYKLYQQFTTKNKVVRVVGQRGDQYLKITPADLVGDFDVVPESDSTLETDQTAEFQKFLNLFQVLQPYVKQQTIDPVTGQPTEVGILDQNELIKELLNRSGEKDPERYYGQDQAVLGAPQGQAQANPGFGAGELIPQAPGIERLF